MKKNTIFLLIAILLLIAAFGLIIYFGKFAGAPDVEPTEESKGECFNTVKTTSPYNHVHRWCEGDAYTNEFCAANVSCHRHTIKEEDNITGPANEDNHTHELKNIYINSLPGAIDGLINIKKNLVVIDISSAEEYASGHLPKAKNYALESGALEAALPEWDKKIPYVIYGRDEEKSKQAAQKMIDSGFKQVFRLLGEFAAWEKGDYKIEK